MGYTKNSWQSGDIITKIKLDHMEDGIYGAYPFMCAVDENSTLDKKASEIVAAVHNKDQVIAVLEESENSYIYFYLVGYFYDTEEPAYYFNFVTVYSGSAAIYTGTAATADDYPVLSNDGGGGGI